MKLERQAPARSLAPRPVPSRRTAVGALGWVALSAAFPARSQFGNPGFMMPDSATPAPASSVPNASDRLFVLLMGQGNLAEIELSRLARDKAQNPLVRQFAQRMQKDHDQAGRRLAAVAREIPLGVPTLLTKEQWAQREWLSAMSDGGDFEVAYLRDQKTEHQKSIQLLNWEITAGQIQPLQQLAAATLPLVLDHLATVQQLLGELTGSARGTVPDESSPGWPGPSSTPR